MATIDRSTRRPRKRYERVRAVVLGAGPLGLGIAWKLRGQGAEVVVVHKDPIGGGTTGTHAPGLVEMIDWDDRRASRWLREQLTVLGQLYNDDSFGFGLDRRTVTCYARFEEDLEKPVLTVMPQYRKVESPHPLLSQAVQFTTFVVRPRVFLTTMGIICARWGVRFDRLEVSGIEEIERLYRPDVIVIAAGRYQDRFTGRSQLESQWEATYWWPVPDWARQAFVAIDEPDPEGRRGSIAFEVPQRRGGRAVLGSTQGASVPEESLPPREQARLVAQTEESLRTLLPPGQFDRYLALGEPVVKVGPRSISSNVVIEVLDRSGPLVVSLSGCGTSALSISFGVTKDAIRVIRDFVDLGEETHDSTPVDHELASAEEGTGEREEGL